MESIREQNGNPLLLFLLLTNYTSRARCQWIWCEAADTRCRSNVHTVTDSLDYHRSACIYRAREYTLQIIFGVYSHCIFHECENTSINQLIIILYALRTLQNVVNKYYRFYICQRVSLPWHGIQTDTQSFSLKPLDDSSLQNSAGTQPTATAKWCWIDASEWAHREKLHNSRVGVLCV